MFSQKNNEYAEELHEILQTYQTIADSNPNKLRALIPAKETWRFFIDGIKQENGRELKFTDYFNDKSLANRLFSQNFLNLTIKQYAERREKIKINKPADWNKSLFWDFLKAKNWGFLSVEEREQLSLRDLLNLDKAWMPFESETGYLRALITAFQEIFNPPLKLDVSFIKKLHQLSMTNVEDTIYKEVKEKLDEFSTDNIRYFGLSTINATEEGLFQILHRANPHISIRIRKADSGVKINEDGLKKIREYVKSGKLARKELSVELGKYFYDGDATHFIEDLEDNEQIANLIERVGSTENNEDVAKVLYELMQDASTTGLKFFLQSQHEPDTQKMLGEEMQQLVDDFNGSIATLNGLQKLTAIVSFVQSCYQLHPFTDANCRTFSMLLLNSLLINNGFPLVMLDDPNRFGAFSKEELLTEVINGMRNTFELIEQQKLFNVDTDEVQTFLESKEILKNKYGMYFQEAISIEEKARATLSQSLS